jgi:hypothetical protein
MEIRDPIFGPLGVHPAEKRVLDHPLVQRLRRVRQLGFSEATFPGATHTRYLHSVGSMHLAGEAFDAVAPDLEGVPAADLRRARATLRLAALLHDLGHGPMSHTGEGLLPRVRDLTSPPASDTPDRRVTHEEMTRWLLLNSDLRDVLGEAYADVGVRAEDVALVLGEDGEDVFRFGHRSALGLMRQLIAGEIDVDRMDYLKRDSYFTGVSYGHYEKDWLLSHMGAHPVDGAWCLALDSSAIFAFEDFLLSRYHMFLMVYAHQRTMSYHRLLARFLEGEGRGLSVPADPAGFVACDDEWFLAHLRASGDPSARRVVEGRPLPLAVEAWDEEADTLERLRTSLEADLPASCEWVESGIEFSRDFPGGRRSRIGPPLLVRVAHAGSRRTVVPVEVYSDLYVRQARRKRVLRIYCQEDDVAAVEALVATVVDAE